MNPNINSFSDMNNNNNNNNGNDFGPARSAISVYTEKAKQIFIDTPLFVKSLPILIFILYILTFFFWQISFYFSNMLQYTIFKFQLWRLITATIIMTSLFNIIFAFLFWIPEAIKLEQALGTVRYIILFSINSIIIQFSYVILLIPLKLLIGDSVLTIGLNRLSGQVECNGIWPIIMMDITVLCLANPNNLLSFLCLPWSIKAKYYPFILLAFFILLNGIQLDIVIGAVYGIAYCYLLQSKLHFDNEVIRKCEESFAFKWLKGFKGYVSCDVALGMNSINNAGGYGNSNSNQSNENANLYGNVQQSGSDFINMSSNQQGQQQLNQGFNAFKGKGVVVGGNP